MSVEFVDCFDGLSALESLLNPTPSVESRISPSNVVKSKPVDKTDLKLIAFLQGKKVYFQEEELEYIYY